MVFSASAQTTSRSRPWARAAAGVGEEPPPEAAALAFRAHVELVDLAAARGAGRAAAPERGVAGGPAAAVDHQRAEPALVHPAPPAWAAAGDHPLERQPGDDAGVSVAPGVAVDVGEAPCRRRRSTSGSRPGRLPRCRGRSWREDTPFRGELPHLSPSGPVDGARADVRLSAESSTASDRATPGSGA